MLNVSDVRKITCGALRDKVDQSISESAAAGRESVIVGAKDVPVWLEAELTSRGFILNRYNQNNGPVMLEIFWGAIKE